MPQHTAIIRALHNVARPIILQRFRADSCIGSTAVAIAVLRAFGVAAHPVAGTALVHNPQLVKHMMRGEPPPDSSPEQLARCRQDGCWQVGLGLGLNGTGIAAPGRWAGHLWALVGDTEHSWLVDLSLDQANRPERHILLEPLVAPVQPDEISAFVGGHEPLALELNGCLVVYQAQPENTGYQTSPNWTRPEAPVISAVVKAMAAELGDVPA